MMNQTYNNTDSCQLKAELQFYLFPVVYCLVMILGLPANLGALWFFFRNRKQRTSSDVLIVNLTVADTSFLCSLPFRIHYHLQGNVWRLGKAACLFSGIAFHVNIYVSVLFMTSICVDRYMATVHPIVYLCLRNTCYTVIVSTAIWFLCALGVLLLILGAPNGQDTKCIQNNMYSDLGLYGNLCVLSVSLMLSAVILVCYPLVARRITHIRSDSANKARRIIYAIVAITLLCFLPYSTVRLLHFLYRVRYIESCAWADAFYKARSVTMALLSLNSCLDPLIYYFSRNQAKWSWPRLSWLQPKPVLPGSGTAETDGRTTVDISLRC
ncbi:hypothetical protein ACEWY4_005286 [Coilia grayii]|uniref:G-protein coupled receptors family 1 profile domain-containing protein n=1 Tax=Coilia grayii TaxID=363190 RepID=A0ABD1KII9_9TELE